MDNSFDNLEDQEKIKISQIEVDASRFDRDPDANDLPVIATRNLVLFPRVTIPISLGRHNSLVTAREASENAIPVGIICQMDPEEEHPAVTTGLYKYGVVADVLNVFELPDGSHTALICARNRFRLMGRGAGMTIPAAELSARVRIMNDIIPLEDQKFDVLVESIREGALKVFKSANDNNALVQNFEQIKSADTLVNFVATNIPVDPAKKCEMLSKGSLFDRALILMSEINILLEKIDLTHDIMKRTKRSMEEHQRSAFLQQQMDTIKEELYGDAGDDEIERLVNKANEVMMPQAAEEVFNREVEKLRRYNPQSPDYAVQYTYLETLLSLPWNKYTTTENDLSRARDILEAEHYGLEKVKTRILEQLAVLMNNPDGKAPILCLVGAPGVGKTSVGKSVAHALGREYARVSLGGLHDEAEIRGHRKTYIGAMPGRIIDAMKRAKVGNPVLLLDEIDKIGADFKGDPAAALLEVLDPEQNCRFHDNYIDVDYDLSHVLFIATANSLGTIARPLLDRMEIIDISGYLLEEKIEIARRHLIPRAVEELKLPETFAISDAALKSIISSYTSESGVRHLEKKILAVGRKAVLALMLGEDFPSPVEPDNLYDILGLAPRLNDTYEGNDFAGVVTGLAWTEVGGEILLAESSLSPSKGAKLTVTGNLGDVMKESASIAYEWVKAHHVMLGIDAELFEKYSLHVHFPEGAIPKDGPSAGITIATSIVSAFRQTRVAERVAMTGEITLRGSVLPVGGIKEKILAAKRAGIDTIILSSKNRRDIEDIPAKYLEGMTFKYVDRVDEVISLAVTDVPAVGALTL